MRFRMFAYAALCPWGMDRGEINEAIFFGLGREASNSVLPSSPLFKDEYADAWIEYDVDQANELLDEAGFDKRNDDGVRLMPDGRPFEIIVETAGEQSQETDYSPTDYRPLERHWGETSSSNHPSAIFCAGG